MTLSGTRMLKGTPGSTVLRLGRVAAAIGEIEETIGDEVGGAGIGAYLVEPDRERGDRPVDAEGERDLGKAEAVEILGQRIAVEIERKIDPIAMLFWAAVLNGVVSVPIMAAMMLTVSGKMRDKLALPRWLYRLGWLATALMALAVGAYAVVSLMP
jgi:hypothetical protein